MGIHSLGSKTEGIIKRGHKKGFIGSIIKEKKMKNSMTTDWDVLLSNPCGVKTLNKFASGVESARGVTSCFANTERAGEFRKLVRTYGSTYARRLTRKALRYRGLMK